MLEGLIPWFMKHSIPEALPSPVEQVPSPLNDSEQATQEKALADLRTRINQEEDKQKKRWGALPTFPIKDAGSLVCPICGTGEIKRGLFRGLELRLSWDVRELWNQAGKPLLAEHDLFGAYQHYIIPGTSFMRCYCSCGKVWDMKIPKMPEGGYTRKLYCSFCGTNYDRTKSESCPGCGSRE